MDIKFIFNPSVMVVISCRKDKQKKMFLKKLSKKEKVKQRESRNEFHLIIKRYRAIGNPEWFQGPSFL